MPDNLLNPNLGPITWTTGATGDGPHPEGRERKRDRTAGRFREQEPGRDESPDQAETVDAAPHQLDRFA